MGRGVQREGTKCVHVLEMGSELMNRTFSGRGGGPDDLCVRIQTEQEARVW